MRKEEEVAVGLWAQVRILEVGQRTLGVSLTSQT
jgi:hypothetical protein